LESLCKPLYDRLKKNPKPWIEDHTKVVKNIKNKIKELPCLNIPHPDAYLIVETDASDIGYGGILKQRLKDSKTESLVRFYSGSWNDTQKNYSTVKKEILSIVLNIKKFEDDLYMKPFLLRIDCLSAKSIVEKDVKNLISKQIFARWQALLRMSNSDKKIIIPRPKLPSPPSPLSQTQNRFISLTPYPPTPSPITRPTYSVLARLQGMPSSPNLYNRPSTTTSPSTNKTEFHINPNTQVIKILEPIEEQKLNQSFSVLLDHLFPKEANFYNNDFQTRQYYEAILLDSQSVQIRHNYNKSEPEKIEFSKVKIMKVISLKDWGNRPFINRVLSCYPEYPAYNYYDYIEAWDKAFLLKAHFHTWFFHFAEEFSLDYPRWFIKWFKCMGQIPEAFPSKVLAGYIQYKKMFTQEEAEGTSPPLLVRKFSAKWWKQINECQADKEAVIKYYNSLIQESLRTSTSRFTPASKLSKTNVEIAKKIEECQNDEDFARVISQIRSSPTPSEDLFQDFQDPYDGIDL
ncbi:enzymatic polyprotein, partial [Tanacetum coccineum]